MTHECPSECRHSLTVLFPHLLPYMGKIMASFRNMVNTVIRQAMFTFDFDCVSELVSHYI